LYPSKSWSGALLLTELCARARLRSTTSRYSYFYSSYRKILTIQECNHPKKKKLITVAAEMAATNWNAAFTVTDARPTERLA
jgi:hypothetical protein